MRDDPATQAYLARRRAKDKSDREIRRLRPRRWCMSFPLVSGVAS